MLPKYQANFAALDADCAFLLSGAILRHYPDFGHVDPDQIYTHCEEMNIDHADVVMSLARDWSPLAVRTLETLVGKPINRGRPCLSPAPQRAPKIHAPKVRNSVTDPRTITFVVANPKKPGSASFDRFALYTVGMTVNAAIAAGVKREDITWDSDAKRGFIKFGVV